MKVKELITKDITVDVYDNVCESLAIAFCGSLKLTPEGEARFAKALELDVDLDEDYGTAIVNVEDESSPDGWKRNLKQARDFFYSAAGYCKDSDWDRWFVENDWTVENSALVF